MPLSGLASQMDSEACRSVRLAESVLARLLEPVTPSEFSREFLERRICLVRRNVEDHFAGLVGFRDLDAVLGSHDVHRGGIRLARGDDHLPTDEYSSPSGRVDPLLVAKQFDEGATIIFNQLHRRVKSLGEFCSSLGEFFGSRVQANIYLTPPHGQGFKPHWDTHDVFVLQVSGRKRWSIHNTSATLPLRGQTFDSKKDVPGEVKQEFALSPGSVAYIPRGVMHSARSDSETSLHVTVGVTTYTWTDLFLESVAAAALQEPSLRESLPLRFIHADFPKEERDRLVKEKFEGLASRLVPSEVWKHLRDTVLAENSPVLTGLLSSRLHGTGLEGTSRVRRRPGVIAEMETDGDRCALCFLGQELTFAAVTQPALVFLLAAQEFTVDEIPDCLKPEAKLTLANRLVAEGLLEVSS